MRQILAFVLAWGWTLPAAASDWQWAVNGNFQYDHLRLDDEDRLSSDGAVRRSRLALSVKAPTGLDAKAEFDAFNNVWTDAFVRWRPNAKHAFRVGQFKQPIYLDELSSDRSTMFMEQGLPGSFAIARRMGVDYTYGAGVWRASLSAFRGNLAGLQRGQGWGGRLVWAPRNRAGEALHLAAAASNENPDSDSARFSSRAEASNFASTRFDTRTIAGVERIARVGLEALWIGGPWSVQSEYLRTNLRRNVGADLSFDGWYLQASWFLGSDHRAYKDGVIEAPNLGEDGSALELAVRLSMLDLDDQSVLGGNTRNLTLGANWYINKHVRLMLNYVRVDGQRGSAQVQPNILESRLQLTF